MCYSRNEKEGKNQTILDNYLMIYSSLPKETRAKVAVDILIQRKLINEVEKLKYVSDRIIGIRMKPEGKRVNIIGIYAPEK